MERLKVAVLISGRGSNLEALIRATATQDFPAEIVLVVSNVPSAQGLVHAIKADIPTVVVDHCDYADRYSFESTINLYLHAAGIEMICLAGFMRLLTANFVTMWSDRILNIHPSLLPAFKGLHTHERVLKAGVHFTGCTVHFVRPAMDAGPILAQTVVPVFPSDTIDLLAARVLEAEHNLYPFALRLVGKKLVRIKGDVIDIEGFLLSPQPLFNATNVPETKARII